MTIASDISETHFLAELTDRARSILNHWQLPDQVPKLLKYRENAVFKVFHSDGRAAAMRLHRPGYHSEDEIRSELAWMRRLGQQGQRVPSPLATLDGHDVVPIRLNDGTVQTADLIDWMAGEPVGESGKPLQRSAIELGAIYHDVGVAIAAMHNVADRWETPPDFSRPAWNLDGLLGETPLWGRFWENPLNSPPDRELLSHLRHEARLRLESSSTALDYGLIHADVIRENILVGDTGISIIDFDDCGYGWRAFDLATTLIRNLNEPHYQTIKRSLLDGYRSRRPFRDEDLPLFLLLRSLTYIGWLNERPEIPNARDLLKLFMADTMAIANQASMPGA